MVQKKSIYGVLIAALLALCMLGAGCTSQPTEQGNATATPTPVATTSAPAANVTATPTPATNATATPAATEIYVFNETANNTTATVAAGSNVTIRLDENPTTGYSWNVTSSTGLQYVNDTFIAPQTEIMGAGGVHVWEYIAAEKGAGEFSAVYMQPWMNVTGNETTFSMAFTIE